MSDEQDLSSKRIVWLFNSVGASGSLLYWNGILPGYLNRFPNSWFFTARPPSLPIAETDASVDCVGSWRIPLGRRKGSYDRQLVVGSPKILSTVRRLRPDALVIQEFLSFAAYFGVRRRMPAKRILLLESDPVRGIASRNKWWTRMFRRQLAKNMDLFLTNNTGGAEYLTNKLGVNERRIVVGSYLVSEPRTEGKDGSDGSDLPSKETDKVVFLFVGQLIERKGVRELIQAFAELPPELKERARVWIVGDGEQREMLEGLVDSRQLSSVVKFLGRRPYETLPAIYQSADVFVMPTLDDYRALVGFEALRCGLPMLHSIYDGAVHEVVEDYVNGFQIDPRDAAAFADRIKWILTHGPERKVMAENSRQRSQSFTIENAIDTLGTAIQRVFQD